MYCHQNTLFHAIHWLNKYILIPLLYLNTHPLHIIKAAALGNGHSAVALLDYHMINKVNILFRFLLKAPFPINLLVQPYSNSSKN